MAEYIEREEIRRAYEKLTRSYVNCNPYIADWRFDEMIEKLPAADVATVRHGRWEFLGPNRLIGDCMCGTCSVCKVRCKYIVNKNICPNCGAKMYGDRKEGADNG